MLAKLNEKYQDFVRYEEAEAEFLEGTTSSGKTTIGVFKFMKMVVLSSKKQHVIAGLDLGTVEKNIVTAENGITDLFGDWCVYRANGGGDTSLPHIKFRDKTIFVLGYDNKERWKKALGGQYGCMYIDEINIANIEFVREAFMRCDYVMATLNPDNPLLPIYADYINRARPIAKYSQDGPEELRAMLDEPKHDGWVWWYFSFDDNTGITEEKKQKIISGVPKGTKLYKNKILGLRGVSEGLVYDNWVSKEFDIDELRKDESIKVCYGLDFGFTHPFGFIALFLDLVKKKIYIFDEMSETGLTNKKIAESIIQHGYSKEVIYGDSASPTGIAELREEGISRIRAASKPKDSIIQGIQFIQNFEIIVYPRCKKTIEELSNYCWAKDSNGLKSDKPAKEYDHLMDSMRYAIGPHILGDKYSFD